MDAPCFLDLSEAHPLMEAVVCLPTLALLQEHVRSLLCGHDQLDPSLTPLHQAVITRAGRPCGLFFQVQGPRMVRNYAVWAGDEARILFYDSTGQRFAESRLSDAPDPLELTRASKPARRSA
jgi:hypothetical protein